MLNFVFIGRFPGMETLLRACRKGERTCLVEPVHIQGQYTYKNSSGADRATIRAAM